MPKMKTNRAAAKRFTRTGSGKFKIRKANSSHILTKKTRKRKRNLRQGQIADKTNQSQLLRLMPYA
ncbi:50S ribosomal protein L35 [Desulfobotulus sp.]|uniref:50S ribosomal protein L35 n=1 Tax=Desulfobotulus sp. TaxID=1940337 RepID=UPI002A35B419|nr:50S ribosomal protein L35 [Desulfobotulus sp.]MDY0163696.1 50S ribosomal protein L35 [Desulfobotulus sp.]